MGVRRLEQAGAFDPRKLNWLGSISKAISVCIAWAESPYKSIDDAIARPMRLSGTGAGGWRVTLPRLYNLVAGTKFEMKQQTAPYAKRILPGLSPTQRKERTR